MILDAYGLTETGPVRPANEDHILMGRFVKNRGGFGLCFSSDDDFLAAYGIVFAVADGVGGERGGATASRVALSALDAQFYSAEKGENPVEACRASIEAGAARANETVLRMAGRQPELAGMACTLAGICLTGMGGLVFHAGDSRVYRFRNSALKQLTQDDSLAMATAESGRMTIPEAEASPAAGTITNCVGSRSFKLTVHDLAALRHGDRLLICSDGLHGELLHDQIEAALGEASSSEAAANTLLDAAVQAGGRDNVSIICIHCTE